MSLFDKITRLHKIPEMLKHKQEEEKERQKKKRRDQEEKRFSKFINDEVTISQESKAHLEVKRPPRPEAFEAPDRSRKKEKGMGEKLDLRI